MVVNDLEICSILASFSLQTTLIVTGNNGATCTVANLRLLNNESCANWVGMKAMSTHKILEKEDKYINF
jgi:hypothetical protein